MARLIREIRYFLFSQYFSDGLRITVAILLPSVLLFRLGMPDRGLLLSLGALSIGITDMPGPWQHKRNGMLYGCLCVFLTALLTVGLRHNPYWLGLEVVALSFFYALLTVFGSRAAAVGSAGLLVMIVLIGRTSAGLNGGLTAALMLAGGLWYTAISLLFYRFRPYRPAQQALGECIHEMARFLRIKAAFYDPRTDIDANYRRVVAQQVIVSERQDAVRELLFKSRQYVGDSTRTGRILVLTFADVVDLYEQMAAMYYDYASLRAQFAQTGLLADVARLIRQVAHELDAVGLAIQANQPVHQPTDLTEPLNQLRARIDALARARSGRVLVLLKILVNLRQLSERTAGLLRYHVAPPDHVVAQHSQRSGLDYTRFVSHRELNLTLLRDNLTLRSAGFRYALRMALACLVGYGLTRLLAYGEHSYWVLLTITVILKPAYSLTKQRNADRLLGTLGGGVLGGLVLWLVPNVTARFAFLVVFMLLAFSFQRRNYTTLVFFVTAFILIVFSFMGEGFVGIAGERLIDTLIGGAIAFSASYLLFPSWESEQLLPLLRDVVAADLHYVRKLADSLAGRPVTLTEYKLARKDVYVQAANLSAAFQRMLSEPRRKQRHRRSLYEFVVLNHILSSNVATIAIDRISRGQRTYPPDVLRPVGRTVGLLEDALQRLEAAVNPAEPGNVVAPVGASDRKETESLAGNVVEPQPGLNPPNRLTAQATNVVEPADGNVVATLGNVVEAGLSADDQLLKEQVEFIQKLSADLLRLTEQIRRTEPAA